MKQTMLAAARVLVIGGSSGIGEATARLAAQAGAAVTIAARGEPRLGAALVRLPAATQAARLDVTDAAAVEAFFASHPPWDHVVLAGSSTLSGPVRDAPGGPAPGGPAGGATGGAPAAPVPGLPLADAHAAMQNKFWGAYHVGRWARLRDGGSITFVSGVYSVRPNAGAVLQGSINAAIEALTRGLALELAPGVRVNAVSPSTTATPLWDRLGPAGRADKLATMSALLPLRRVAQPDDIAQAILFVATNPFATGSTVLIDGGDALL